MTGGGTAQNPDGEIAYCDIEISLEDNKKGDNVKWLAELLNKMGIPKGFVLQGIEPEIEVGTLEGLAYYSNGVLPSFDLQIKKAENRGDLVSVNHRVTEFLASYFDIIFALNEMTHPGEKRMQSICSKECKILPDNFDANLNKLFDKIFRENVSPVISDMVAEIKKVCKEFLTVAEQIITLFSDDCDDLNWGLLHAIESVDYSEDERYGELIAKCNNKEFREILEIRFQNYLNKQN